MADSINVYWSVEWTSPRCLFYIWFYVRESNESSFKSWKLKDKINNLEDDLSLVNLSPWEKKIMKYIKLWPPIFQLIYYFYACKQKEQIKYRYLGWKRIVLVFKLTSGSDIIIPIT
jgi:hypothetical protein